MTFRDERRGSSNASDDVLSQHEKSIQIFLYPSSPPCPSSSLVHIINYELMIKAASKGNIRLSSVLAFDTHCRMLVSNSYLACGTGIWLTIE